MRQKTSYNVARRGKHICRQSRFAGAKEVFESGLEITKALGDRRYEAAACNNLGCFLFSICGYKKAKEYLKEALAMTIEIGDREGEAATCNNLGDLLQLLGEHQKAKEYHEKALPIMIEIGERRG